MNLLYIDPGTGSMLFSLAIGLVTTLVFAFRALVVKMHFILSGGKSAKISANKIPYVIFTDHKRYWNVFKPVCDEFEKRKIPLVYYTQSQDDPAFSEKYEFVKAEFIGEGNKGFVKMNMLNAGIVLSSTPGLDIYQWKRSKNVQCYVHILHQIDSPLRYRMFGLAYYDVVLLNGNHQERHLRMCESSQGSPQKELAITGATFMDSLLARSKELAPVKNENPVVLLAPTWGKTGLLSLYGTELIDALVATGFKTIIRPHPQSSISEKTLLETLAEHYKDNVLVEWNFDNDNAAILNKTDIMVSDISGVMFDLAFVFDKPFLYANSDYDGSIYDSWWVNEPMWSFNVTPILGKEIKREDFKNLKEIIITTLQDQVMTENRKKIRDEAWHYQGQGGTKTVDYLVEKQKQLNGGMGNE